MKYVLFHHLNVIPYYGMERQEREKKKEGRIAETWHFSLKCSLVKKNSIEIPQKMLYDDAKKQKGIVSRSLLNGNFSERSNPLTVQINASKEA